MQLKRRNKTISFCWDRQGERHPMQVTIRSSNFRWNRPATELHKNDELELLMDAFFCEEERRIKRSLRGSLSLNRYVQFVSARPGSQFKSAINSRAISKKF